MPHAHATHWDHLDTEEVLPGITRQVLHGQNQTVVRYCYDPGSVFPLHAHEQEQVTMVLSGTIVLTVDGQELELGPGGIAVIAPWVPHGAEVRGGEPVETLNAMTPKRTVAPAVAPVR